MVSAVARRSEAAGTVRQPVKKNEGIMNRRNAKAFIIVLLKQKNPQQKVAGFFEKVYLIA